MPRTVTSREGYAAWAESYDAFDNPLIAMCEIALASMAIDVRDRRVLELGCGTGRNAARFLHGGAAAYVGVDASPEMLAAARTRTDDARAAFVEADVARPLPALGAPFDLVFTSLVLEHFEDATPVFAAAGRVAHAGAALVALELHPALHARGARAHVRVEGDDWMLPSHPHDASELRVALARGGWEIASACDWYASARAARSSAKLARHRGSPVLLAVTATRVLD